MTRRNTTRDDRAIHVRLDAAAYDSLAEAAHAARLTVTQYARQLLTAGARDAGLREALDAQAGKIAQLERYVAATYRIARGDVGAGQGASAS